MKKPFRMFALAVACAATLATPLAASAHAIWFAQRAGELALVYGHGAEDLSVIKRLDKITSVRGVGAAGDEVPVSLTRTDHLAFVKLDSSPAIVTATLDNGLWSQGPDGKWVGKGKDEVPGAQQSGRYLKYTSHLRVLPQGAVAPVPGLGLQLVPAGPKFPHHKGETLTLRVLLDGKPAVGALVRPDAVNDPDAKPVKAGRDGLVTLKVRNQGLNVIEAQAVSPPADAAKADKTAHTATLSFVLEHMPE